MWTKLAIAGALVITLLSIVHWATRSSHTVPTRTSTTGVDVVATGAEGKGNYSDSSRAPLQSARPDLDQIARRMCQPSYAVEDCKQRDAFWLSLNAFFAEQTIDPMTQRQIIKILADTQVNLDLLFENEVVADMRGHGPFDPSVLEPPVQKALQDIAQLLTPAQRRAWPSELGEHRLGWVLRAEPFVVPGADELRWQISRQLLPAANDG